MRPHALHSQAIVDVAQKRAIDPIMLSSHSVHINQKSALGACRTSPRLVQTPEVEHTICLDCPVSNSPRCRYFRFFVAPAEASKAISPAIEHSIVTTTLRAPKKSKTIAEILPSRSFAIIMFSLPELHVHPTPIASVAQGLMSNEHTWCKLNTIHA